MCQSRGRGFTRRGVRSAAARPDPQPALRSALTSGHAAHALAPLLARLRRQRRTADGDRGLADRHAGDDQRPDRAGGSGRSSSPDCSSRSAVNAVLLRRAFAPLERPGGADGDGRPAASRPATAGRRATTRSAASSRVQPMLDRLETERRESGRRVLAAQEAERVRHRAESPRRSRPGADRRPAAAELDRRGATRRTATTSTRQRRPSAALSTRCVGSRANCGPEMLEHLGLVERVDRAGDDVRARRGRAGRAPSSTRRCRSSPPRPSSPSTASRRRA